MDGKMLSHFIQTARTREGMKGHNSTKQNTEGYNEVHAGAISQETVFYFPHI